MALEAEKSSDASDTARPASVVDQMGTVIGNHCVVRTIERAYWRNHLERTNLAIVTTTAPMDAASRNPLTMRRFFSSGRWRKKKVRLLDMPNVVMLAIAAVIRLSGAADACFPPTATFDTDNRADAPEIDGCHNVAHVFGLPPFRLSK
jgi:hypothetical protein